MILYISKQKYIMKQKNQEIQRHECHECPSSFKDNKSLQYHIKTRHLNTPQTYTCAECDQHFKYKSSYIKHKSIMHEPLTYTKCDKCPKIFHQKQALRRHQEVEHSENFKRVQCCLCPATYKYKEHLTTHIKRKHLVSRKSNLCNTKAGSDRSRESWKTCTGYQRDISVPLKTQTREENSNGVDFEDHTGIDVALQKVLVNAKNMIVNKGSKQGLDNDDHTVKDYRKVLASVDNDINVVKHSGEIEDCDSLLYNQNNKGDVDYKCDISFNCSHCAVIFDTEDLLLRHMEGINNAEEKLDRINDIMQKESAKDRKQKNQMQRDRFTTRSITRETNSNKSVETNIGRLNDRKCCDCKRSFKLKARLDRQSTCCFRVKKNSTNVNLNEKPVVFMFQCLVCSALFTDICLLQRHRLSEHEKNITIHKCCRCSLMFTQLGDLEQHMERKHKILI